MPVGAGAIAGAVTVAGRRSTCRRGAVRAEGEEVVHDGVHSFPLGLRSRARQVWVLERICCADAVLDTPAEKPL